MASSSLGTREERRRKAIYNFWIGAETYNSAGFVDKDIATLDKIEARRDALIESGNYGNVNNSIAGTSDYALNITRYAEISDVAVYCGKVVECFLPRKEAQTIHSCVTPGKCAKEEKDKESEESIIERSAARARKQIRRYVNANDLCVLVTLTFAPSNGKHEKRYKVVQEEEQRDYDKVRYYLSMFRKRLARKYPKIKWLAVLELHNSEKTSDEKRNTWHVHIATDTSQLATMKGKTESVKEVLFARELEKVWLHGRCHAVKFREKARKQENQDVKKWSNPGVYLSAYVGKDGNQFVDTELRNKKRFVRSQNLIKPKKQAYNRELLQSQGYNRVIISDVEINGYYVGTREIWKHA